MSNGQTKNASLTTALSFHYQVLIGLRHCFAMQENQSIWFERDGDVSLLDSDISKSKQIEVKNYSDALTDHHENFWKTLKNWLAPEFHHKNYGALILHTTQPFGTTTQLLNWNQQNAEKRLNTIQAIFDTRSQEELDTPNPKHIVSLQKNVMQNTSEILREVLGKVVIFTEADDESSLRQSIVQSLIGIPNSNQKSYLQGLIGFVYEQSNTTHWAISYKEFKEKCEQLTTAYCLKQFTLPPFIGYVANQEDVTQHEEKIFIKKIHNIEYHDVIPDALGNWIELHNALDYELEGAPQFRTATNQYQRQLIAQFKRKYATAKRNSQNPTKDSQTLYDTIISESPMAIDGYPSPPLEYKNGLLHDALDNEDHDLHWKIDL